MTHRTPLSSLDTLHVSQVPSKHLHSLLAAQRRAAKHNALSYGRLRDQDPRSSISEATLDPDPVQSACPTSSSLLRRGLGLGGGAHWQADAGAMRVTAIILRNDPRLARRIARRPLGCDWASDVSCIARTMPRTADNPSLDSDAHGPDHLELGTTDKPSSGAWSVFGITLRTTSHEAFEFEETLSSRRPACSAILTRLSR